MVIENLNIPIELCFYVVRNKLINVFKTYIAMKYLFDGQFIFSKENIKLISTLCEIKHGKTTISHINKLIELEWLGFDTKMQKIYIRSFDYIRLNYGFSYRTAIKFRIIDLLKFRAFIVASVISYLVVYALRKKRRAERKKGRSFQPSNSFALNYHEVSCKALAKILKLSTKTAFTYKKLAESNGYISIKHVERPVLVVHFTEVNKIRKFVPDRGKKMRIIPIGFKKYKVIEHCPDMICTFMCFATRKKVNHM